MPTLTSQRRDLTPATIGQRIRGERLRLGLTQQQLADRIGIARGSYRQIEAGTDLHLSTLFALAYAGVRLKVIIGELLMMDGSEGWRFEIDDQIAAEKRREMEEDLERRKQANRRPPRSVASPPPI